MEKQIFVHKLIHWYQTYKRDLPWRHTQNPYFIWLSEVILQQTRVKQGLPYYLRFIESFPTIELLANAEEKEVLRLWQGLGYYSRARNMHLTAKTIMKDYGGEFPKQYQELLKLKGIGTYTAAAIASFAFNEKAAVLDGNVFRVLARVFGVETDISSHEAKKVFSALAANLLPDEQTDVYNQAIMEFGAVQCTPHVPDCMFCPLNFTCVANLTGRQGSLPVKSKKAKVKQRFFHYFVIRRGDEFYMKERQEKDIWSGLYDFYLREAAQLQTLEELTENEGIATLLKTGLVEEESRIFTHVLTHQRIQVKFWHLHLPEEIFHSFLASESFYTIDEIKQLPKPILIANYLNSHFF
ncbi:MAG: A/G-specific adenine glycosylase [Bacteroidota bacterium]